MIKRTLFRCKHYCQLQSAKMPRCLDFFHELGDGFDIAYGYGELAGMSSRGGIRMASKLALHVISSE